VYKVDNKGNRQQAVLWRRIKIKRKVLRFNNVAALLPWTAFRYIAGRDFECHKRFGFPHWTLISF
jgi:hypothetical protein